MELDITDFFNNAAPMDYAASASEIGQDAGRITWRAAVDDYDDFNLLDTPEKQTAAVDWFSGFGAWTPEELAARTPAENNALLLQFIAGDIREFSDNGPDEWDWHAYEIASAAGSISGRLFSTDDGRVYFYMGD